MLDLSDNVALVTGASGGIGAATSRKLAENGADVVVTDVVSEIDAVADDVRSEEADALALQMDVTDSEEVNDVVETAEDELGTIDILANIAGIFPTHTLAEMSEEDWDSVIDINLNGTYNCAQAVIPAMCEQGYGRIVTTSSAAGGQIGWSNDLAHYAASKGACSGSRGAPLSISRPMGSR